MIDNKSILSIDALQDISLRKEHLLSCFQLFPGSHFQATLSDLTSFLDTRVSGTFDR